VSTAHATPVARTLGSLLADAVPDVASPERTITGLSQDSRKVRPGDCFFALRGHRTDGARFAAEACARGAVAIVTDNPGLRVDAAVPVQYLPGLREQLGCLAARFYGYPTRGMPVVAVTGTNGKTTVAHLAAQAFDFVDHPCGYVGTLGAGRLHALDPDGMTTPEPVTLQAQLSALRAQGCAVVTLEASSHALAQSRLAGVRVDTAIFTGLGHDHLDYHASVEEYFAAKARLFTHPGLRHAVLNVDDPWGERIAAQLPPSVSLTTFGIGTRAAPAAKSRIRLLDADYRARATRVTLAVNDERMSFATPLLGEFNVRNLLAALAALLGLGVAVTPAIAALSRVQPVRGRMERFGGDAGKPLIFVDYAHSPDSLERVLLALRALRPARLHCVFGCGGNRDRSKRPRMGEIAARLADAVIVTSDNPRDEAPQDIADEIVAGMAVGARYRILLDRDQAITLALKAAGPDDIVVIAGKGHEQTQETGGARAPHSDQATVERWLQGAML
jgi:UDP-N-acetylmuramoyl-L-alanyl-D-glutamate--2,6-diaminopimelate ligase